MPQKAPEIQLQEYKHAVNTALEEFFADAPELLGFTLTDTARNAFEKVREYTMRSGKRVRGSLARLAYDHAAGTRFGAAGLRAAVALELAQSYLLIIDDVMDRSALRRGLPTVHMQYRGEQKEKQAARNDHLADMQAINAGLIAQHLMNLALTGLEVSGDNIAKATHILHKNLAATGFGQIEDMYQEVDSKATEAAIIRKYELKCSYYTFICPLQVGLALGGVHDDTVLQEAASFGLSAGVAFQLTDDLVGVFGASSTTGKAQADDIEEGKYTVLVQYALTHANKKDRDFLVSQLGASSVSEGSMKEVQRIFEDCGAKQYVEKQAESYGATALKKVASNAYWSENVKEILNFVITYATQRKK